MIRRLINLFAGSKWLQPFFEMLYKASIYGMNYGRGGNFTHSGELVAAKFIKSELFKADKPLVLFDVGANRGNYSLEISKVFQGINFTLYAFEPSEVIYKEMQQALAANQNIIPNHFGFGEIRETKILYKRSAMSGLASLYQRRLSHFGIDMNMEEKIQLSTIDLYCSERNIERIHFLKLDIEGHELKCLSGASQMLKNGAIDFIQFEFGGCNIDSRTYFQDFWYLLQKDYIIYRIIKNGLVPILQYNERLEIFKNINYLAALKRKK